MGSLNCSCQCLKQTQEDKKPFDLETKQETTLQENDINYIDIIIPPNTTMNVENKYVIINQSGIKIKSSKDKTFTYQ